MSIEHDISPGLLRQIGQAYLARSQGLIGVEGILSFSSANQQLRSRLIDLASVSAIPLAGFGVEIDVVMHDILMRDDFLEESQVCCICVMGVKTYTEHLHI